MNPVKFDNPHPSLPPRSFVARAGFLRAVISRANVRQFGISMPSSRANRRHVEDRLIDIRALEIRQSFRNYGCTLARWRGRKRGKERERETRTYNTTEINPRVIDRPPRIVCARARAPTPSDINALSVVTGSSRANGSRVPRVCSFDDSRCLSSPL